MCLYNQTLADIRSTGAGIKCLYCRSLYPVQRCDVASNRCDTSYSDRSLHNVYHNGVLNCREFTLCTANSIVGIFLPEFTILRNPNSEIRYRHIFVIFRLNRDMPITASRDTVEKHWLTPSHWKLSHMMFLSRVYLL